MRCRIIVLGMIFTFVNSANAQISSVPAPINPGFSGFQHQIGINIAQSIRQSDQRFPALDYRFAYKPQRVIRVQLGFDGRKSNTNGDGSSNQFSQFPVSPLDSVIREGPDERTIVNIRAGHLWYFPTSDRVSIFVGAEAAYRYFKTDEKKEYVVIQSFNPNNIFRQTTDIQSRQWSHRYGFSPSIGLSYKFNDRFVVSLESTMSFYWSTTVTKRNTLFKTENLSFPNNNSSFRTNGYRKTNAVDFLFDPFMGLVFGYRL